MHRFAIVFALFLPGVAVAQDGDVNAGALSLLAPLVAIGAAVLSRRVVPSLALGVAVAALVAAAGAPLVALQSVGALFIGAATDLGHLQVALFTLTVAAIVGLLTASEAMRAMVERIEGLARGRRGAMVVSWLAGGVVFFDDYANCLVVGNTMQSVVDRFKVSRAKLAYIVDATAAPVASLAVVSTWVAFQVDEIGKGLAEQNLDSGGAFAIFLASVPYSFYCWFTLVFVGAIAISGRDFGPMFVAEQAAMQTEHAVDETKTSVPAWIAPVSIGMLVLTTFAVMLWTGLNGLGEAASGARLFEIIGAADAYIAMVAGGLVALAVAVVLVVATKVVAVQAVPSGMWGGIKPVLHALVILLLAWTLSAGIASTGTGSYLETLVTGNLAIQWLPAVSFLVAAITAFATGSSFSAMGILVPVVVSIAVAVTGDAMSGIALACTASILSGACLGDHASPISDTTVLSSIGSGVDLVTHVRTQLPYVLCVGTVSVFLGYIPAGFGVSPLLLLPLGAVACVAIVMGFGRVPTAAAAAV
jgi:Na+/H+ antiporter NhaC